MITIYHNPRCSKSRQSIEILDKLGREFKVVKYLEDSPSEKKLFDIIHLLKIKPIDLVRQGESLWKDNYKGKNLTDKDIIKAMALHPKLIERPIVVNGDKAVIGRPPKKIHAII